MKRKKGEWILFYIMKPGIVYDRVLVSLILKTKDNQQDYEIKGYTGTSDHRTLTTNNKEQAQ